MSRTGWLSNSDMTAWHVMSYQYRSRRGVEQVMRGVTHRKPIGRLADAVDAVLCCVTHGGSSWTRR